MKLNSTDYILLAYLKSSPLHVYRLAEILQDDGIDSWSQYSIPHLYYSLRRLKKDGLVEIKEKPAKSRPPQKIYSLSTEGKSLLEQLEIDDSLISGDQYFQFDMVLGLSEKLGFKKEKLLNLVTKRIESIQKTLIRVQDMFKERELEAGKLSAGERIAFKHRIRFLKSEIDFYRKSLKELK
jgi:DNA-binding PadR family transcriptional regulator